MLSRDSDRSFSVVAEDQSDNMVQALKKLFLTQSYATRLKGVRWSQVQGGSFNARNPSSREGHEMCILGERVIVTGGYSEDERIHVLNLNPPKDDPKRWVAISPRGERPPFAYGASLTALDDHRAVRFGGFRAGGYSRECNQVCLLTIDKEDHSCQWRTIVPSGTTAASPRAYHSATLIQNRYLLFIGGMKSQGSVLEEAILDTVTWTWLDVLVSAPLASPKPSGRHGHSTVLDSTRNRLVLFGGGSGSDLLRSGVDDTEVWELNLGSDLEIADFEESFPWVWNRVHRDANDDSDPDPPAEPRDVLSPAETLCLGRCHVGVKVARDTVVLAFGSGHPTTNGVLGYNLKSDTFIRPGIAGPLPTPRFTAASSVIGNEGWIMVHGGYSVQDGGTKGDTILLDLAPGLERRFGALPIAPNVPSYPPVLDRDVDRRGNTGNLMIGELVAAPVEERPALATRMLGQLMMAGQLGGRAAVILSLVANGTAAFGDEDHGDDSDSEYEEANEYDDDDEGGEISGL